MAVIVSAALHETFYCKPAPLNHYSRTKICLVYYYSHFMSTPKVLYMILYLTPVKQASVVPFGRREEESLEVVVFCVHWRIASV